MTEYSINQAPSTSGSVVILAGILATQCMAQSYPRQHENIDFSGLGNRYHQESNLSTFDQYQNPLTGKYDQSNAHFETAISNFYAELLANQKPLGKEFTKILYDNLWDLYEG
jgi:hypothetical protein